jgi:hypothetical protein
MQLQTLELQGADEYAPFYAGYVSLARDGDVLGLLRTQAATLRAACAGLPDAKSLHRYAPGKWSVKEVIGHLADTERVFAYRLLRIARGDTTPLASFDENRYVVTGEFDSVPLAELVDNFEAARNATISLVDTIPPSAWARVGTASNAPITARALLYIIVGHVAHHLEILRERYGVA